MTRHVRKYNTCMSQQRCVNSRQGSLTQDDYYVNGVNFKGETKYKLRCKECDKAGVQGVEAHKTTKSLLCPTHRSANGWDMELAQKVICSPRIAI